jgi:hypothetical protein
MLEHSIPVEPEIIDQIVTQELEDLRRDFAQSLDLRRGHNGFMTFSEDLELDCEMLEDHISAINKILEYYKGSP